MELYPSPLDSAKGVSNCYVFKSRLQEYAQKVGLSTPVYETIKEGPSHEPAFRSTVIVNRVRYDSLPGFSNRKAAEQSAAEVALTELANSSDIKECISPPVHETGLCKNLLQEYAQKMNFAMPVYSCRKDETSVRVPLFSCSVDIGGILYIGASAKTKKEAEIKAARTALLAIQSSASESSWKQLGNSQLTVLPSKKREPASVNKSTETADTLKPKKTRFKKMKRRRSGDKVVKTQVGNAQVGLEAAMNHMIERVNNNSCGSEISAMRGVLTSNSNGIVQNELSTVANDDQRNYGTPATEVSSLPYGVLTAGQMEGSCVLAGFNHSVEKIETGISSLSNGALTAKEKSKVSGNGDVVDAISSSMGQTEASCLMNGFSQSGKKIEPGVSFVSNGDVTTLVKDASNVSGDGDVVAAAISSVSGQIQDSGMIPVFNYSGEKIESGAD